MVKSEEHGKHICDRCFEEIEGSPCSLPKYNIELCYICNAEIREKIGEVYYKENRKVQEKIDKFVWNWVMSKEENKLSWTTRLWNWATGKE